MTATDAPAEPVVLARREGEILHVTLNRPRAINALSHEMYLLLGEALTRAEQEDVRAILLDGAGERGFCGGGDIKEMAADGAREASRILATEYDLDHRIATSPVPVVGIMDGVTMGGGIGLTAHAAVRVVTERSVLAMPEARIGIVPDVGGNLLFARAPGFVGEYLAVTAGAFGPGDAIALGFADHYVRSERLQELAEALRTLPGAAGEGDVGSAVAAFAEEPPEAELLAVRDWFDPVAESALGDAVGDPAGAARALIAGLESSVDERARETADTVRGMCPASVAVALAQISRTRDLDAASAKGSDHDGTDPGRSVLRAVLDEDLRVLSALTKRQDFAEGVRAQVIDKDRRPRWQPARIEELSAADVEVVASS